MTKEKREALEYLLRMVEGSLADQGQFKAIRAMLSEEPPHADAASLDSPSARAALAGIELARRAHADAIRRLKAVESEIMRGEYSISRGPDGLTPHRARKAWANELAGVIRLLEEGK